MSSARLTEAAAEQRWQVRAALALLFVAVSYNLPLAILNAHVFAVGRGALIGVEVLILGAALLLVATRWDPRMTRWALMIAAFAALHALLTVLRQDFDPKTLRDMLMLATFIMLGMLVPRAALARFLVVIQAVILGVMLFEVSFPEAFGALADSRLYMINSRGFTPEQLAGQSDLFGAVRPDERYLLPFLGWHRASSIFLEPLSTGAYAAFATLAMLLFWRDWRPRTRVFMALSTALILVGSDSRFAGATIVVLLIAAPLLRRAPVPLAIFYLPAAILAARLVSRALDWDPLEDNFPGRIARGMKQLLQLDTAALLGAAIPTPALADSGITYLVVGQSLLGVVMLQLFLYLQPGVTGADRRLAVNGAALSFTLAILVSISMLSIKTAAFYWFLVGTMLMTAPAQGQK